MQCARTAFKSYIRRFSASNPGYVLEQLNNRSLLRVSGQDSNVLLQGLITNDMQHLSHGAGSMYAMFLNNKGRVLYDTIIYRTSADNTYYVEVDTQASDLVKKHLNIYRLRRKIDITSVDDELKVWTHFNAATITTEKQNLEEKILEGKIVPCTSLEKTENNVTVRTIGNHELLIFRDPRLSALGSRIIAPIDSESKLAELYPGTGGPSYKWFRYRLGIGEGLEELPPGNCFPLEANCDYLHGVSFHKGCYIGQELTARTHHTGVVRKRLMPLILNEPFKKDPAKDEIIKSGEANVGKLRGFEQDSGLGLLRIAQALDAELIVNNTAANTVKPNWWPQEVPKEKVSSRKL